MSPFFYTPFRKRLVTISDFQWYWPSWWKLWPSFSSQEEIVDYGIPEYAHLYPKVLSYSFCFGPMQWRGYADS